MSLICYTDGACPRNGRQQDVGGWGVHFATDDADLQDICGRVTSTDIGFVTNNRAELYAVLMAMIRLSRHHAQSITLRTDSTYVQLVWRGGIASVRPKSYPKNGDMIDEMRRMYQEEFAARGRRILVEHVRREENTRADELAGRGMRGGRCQNTAQM